MHFEDPENYQSIEITSVAESHAVAIHDVGSPGAHHNGEHRFACCAASHPPLPCQVVLTFDKFN